jgi:hypothetical protein
MPDLLDFSQQDAQSIHLKVKQGSDLKIKN